MSLPKWWPVALGVVIGIIWLGCYERRQGRLDQQLSEATKKEPALLDTIRVRDTLFVHDTVKLTVVRHRTDSLLRVDTLSVPGPVVREIVRNERASCDSVVRAGESVCAAKDSLNANLRLQIDLLKKSRPSRFTCVLGGGVTTKGADLGGLCGVRLF